MIMVKKKKNDVSIQRKPMSEKRVKEKHKYVPVNPKGQENRDNIRRVGEILGDMQPEQPQGDRKMVDTQIGMSSRAPQNRG